MKPRTLTMMMMLAFAFMKASAYDAGNYGVWMTSAGSVPANVISVLKTELGVSARTAATMTESVPCYVDRDIALADAQDLASKLYAAGAYVEVKNSMVERPLTFEATKNTTVRLYNGQLFTIKYKIDSGEMQETTEKVTEINLTAGQKVSFYADVPCHYNKSTINTAITSAEGCYVYGNIMSMISSTDFATLKTLTEAKALESLFYGCDMENHPSKDLILPATQLSPNCYYQLFQNCTKLTRAPELPATQLAEYCYGWMFAGCSALTQAPALPATTLASNCYSNMFTKCTSLSQAPALPATTLVEHCYDQMFKTCPSLAIAPELPARQLMPYCYYNMFAGCSSLNKITCLANDISATNCTANWLQNVSATGVFYQNPECESWTRSTNGIPEGWTIENAAGFPADPHLAFSSATATVVSGQPMDLPTLVNPNNVPVTYSSSVPEVAAVDASTGEITLLKPGTTEISATFAGNDDYYMSTVKYTLKVNSQGNKTTLNLKAKAVIAAVGQPATVPALTVTDGLVVTYTSSNPEVATVDAVTGEITPMDEGMTTITVSTEGSLQYASAFTRCYVVVLWNADAVRCDSNGDGNVTITDAVKVVDYILNE